MDPCLRRDSGEDKAAAGAATGLNAGAPRCDGFTLPRPVVHAWEKMSVSAHPSRSSLARTGRKAKAAPA